MGERFAVEGIMFKRHAACGGTHSAINGIRAIRAKRPFATDDVADVEIIVSEQLMSVCAIPEPTTAVEGMFSIRYAASLALTDSDTGPNAFTDERVRDPRLAAERKKVRITPVPGGTAGSPTEVRLRLKNGETHTACLDALIVTPDDQLAEQWNDLEKKFHGLVEPVLGASRSKELAAMVRRMETLTSIRALADLTAAGS
jgi:2-methylcitrate dehydratase PrpD